jgi:hypothetical protein
MEIPELDEITVRSLAVELLRTRGVRNWRNVANLYLLVRYGDRTRDVQPGLTLYALSKLLKRPESTLRLWLKQARAVMDPEIARRTAVAVVLCGQPPEESPLYFGTTLQFGREADTRVNHVEETVVLGREIPPQDWTPSMGPKKPCKR